MSEFIEFAKIGRLSRDMVITEKLDGTNAQVFVSEDGAVMAGSRNRWIAVDQDNFGFARWVADHAEELATLGPGRHFGEWWGSGIQRRYGLSEKRFSLFNVGRWIDPHDGPGAPVYGKDLAPSCCHVVPVLHKGPFDEVVASAGEGITMIDHVMSCLRRNGSAAAPGFMNPEGVIVFHTASGALFKKTFEKDDAGKGREAA